MHEIGKLHKFQQLREHCLKKEMFVHKCISQVYKYFHIMLNAKFICLSYFIYYLHSCSSKDIKIICLVSAYGMGKGNMVIEELVTFD